LRAGSRSGGRSNLYFGDRDGIAGQPAAIRGKLPRGIP
jgi:hypothetical protein